MKIQFLAVCAVCAVAAEAAFGQNFVYQNQHQVPVIKDGVPVDTPEVQAAKAAHFRAYARARELAARRPSTGEYVEHRQLDSVAVRPQLYAIAAYSSDVQVDTPEVQQAKALHYASLAQAGGQHHYRTRRGLHHRYDVPEETPEVQAARYQHLVAHASIHEPDDDDYSHNSVAYQGYYHIPVITKKGVPANTPEVKEARQQHLLAHHLAKSGEVYAGGYSQHIPVIAPNGVPYDTPEVFAAKIQHSEAHQKELLKQHHHEVAVEGYAYGY